MERWYNLFAGTTTVALLLSAKLFQVLMTNLLDDIIFLCIDGWNHNVRLSVLKWSWPVTKWKMQSEFSWLLQLYFSLAASSIFFRGWLACSFFLLSEVLSLKLSCFIWFSFIIEHVNYVEVVWRSEISSEISSNNDTGETKFMTFKAIINKNS